MLGAWMLRPRKLQRIDHAAHRHRRAAAFLQLEIQEAEVETGVVRDQRRVLNEFQKVAGLLGEARFVGQEKVAEAVHFLRFEGHVAIGIKITVKMPARFDAVENLDATFLDYAVTAGRIEARSLGVENNFPHGQ